MRINNEQSHYHLGPKDNPKDLEEEADSDYKITKCCGTPVPEVCINLLNQGTTTYEPVTPSDCL